MNHQQQRSGPSHQRPRRTVAPLYDARYEHDACGVGFVADAGGRSRDRVLPLALAGLAALGHRGAFGADGESSDGAGVALPLDRSLVELLAGPELAPQRPGIVSLFLPRGRTAERRARALVDATLTASGLTIAAWRAVPFDLCALGAAAAASRPAFLQAIVTRPARSANVCASATVNAAAAEIGPSFRTIGERVSSRQAATASQ